MSNPMERDPFSWEALSDDDRKRALESMPDWLDGFMHKWGWLHFAKAIEDICKEKNTPQSEPDVVAMQSDLAAAQEAARELDGELRVARDRIAELERQQSEPFGYFKAEPFGWTDCAETDDGAVALYDRPVPMQPAPLSDRFIADTVNTLRDIAINYRDAEQLRARIAHVVVPLLKQPAPDVAAMQDPIPDRISAQLERTDWTPKDALEFYANGYHFDVVAGRTRIIDTGAVASNALKSLSLEYLLLKGDAHTAEQAARIAELERVHGVLAVALDQISNEEIKNIGSARIVARAALAAVKPATHSPCGACADGCKERGSCRLADESPEFTAQQPERGDK